MNRLIDTHAHLYLDQFDEDRDEVIRRALEAGVEKMLLPNIERATYDSMILFKETAPTAIYTMVGLHPCSVKERYEEEIHFVEQRLSDGGHIAVGEIGLDYYWDTSFKKEQQKAFRTQLNWAKDLDLPVAIHCRESMEDILFILADEQDGRLKGVLHCFTGTVDEGKQLIDLGMHIGLGGVITFKKGGMEKVLPELPLEWMLLETDSPFLTPAPNRGKRNESSYIPFIADRLADILRLSTEQVAQQTTSNAEALFALA
jgi:TatD DNase family protein